MYKFIKLCLVIILLSSCGQKYSGEEAPVAQKGVLDLSGWSFEKDGPIKLEGQWNFYWKKLIDPKELQKDKKPKEDGYIKVPGPWTNFKKKTSPLGYATYVLKIKGLEKGKNLALSSANIFSNYLMYKIEKGSVIPFFKVGKIGKTKDTSTPQFNNLKVSFKSNESSFYLLLKVSNFHYRNGAFSSNFKLGLEKEIFWQFDTERYSDFAVLGILLVIFLYHIGLWAKRKEDKTSLYFGLFCGMVFLRKISLGYYLSWFFPIPSNFIFEIEAKINFLTLLMVPPIFSKFLNQLLQNKFKKFAKIITYPAFILGLIVIFSSAQLYSQIHFLLTFQLPAIIAIFYIYFRTAYLSFRRLKYARAVFLGINLLFFGAIHDTLIPFQLASPPEIAPFLLIFFILIQTYILLSKLSNTFKENEYLTKNLEQEVTKKTNELEVEKASIEIMLEQIYEQKQDRDQLLGNLNQGYLTFSEDGLIHDGATKVTEDLLEVDLFGSMDRGIRIWDVLFSNNKDINEFKNWLSKVFEGKFSFKDLNQFSPKNFKGTKNKFIELEFKPIYQEENKKVDKMILIASDRTQEIILEKLHDLDQQNANFITTCLENPVEFTDTLQDTYELIEVYPTIRDMDLGELFRKFHTLKARYGRFGAKKLTNFINEIETTIEKSGIEELDAKVSKLEDLLKYFVEKNKLIIEAAKKFMVDEGNAVKITTLMDKKDEFSSLDNLFSYLKENYLLSDLKKKFERYSYLINELAGKQGKLIEFKLEGDEIRVDTNKYSSFIITSIHLFRNMVDHGIESEDERVNKNKPPKGTISLNFKNQGEMILINLSDDGAGINPKIIKQKVLEKGLKTKEELKNINDTEVLNMIFLPGLSTKEEVTELSGRGVGMDAIEDEVKKLGGEISIKSEIDQGTTFIIKLPFFDQ